MEPQADPETESRGSKSLPRGAHAADTAVEMGCRRRLRRRRWTAAAGDDGGRRQQGGLGKRWLRHEINDLRREKV